MTDLTNELRRLAQAATPGPWILLPVGDKSKCFAVADINFLSVLTVVDECGTSFGAVYLDGDAKFIAAANPAAVSELLDRLEATEEERDGLHHCFNEWIDKTEWVQRGINKGTISPKYLGLHRADVIASLLGAAEKERDALRAELDALKTQEPVAWLHETRRDSDVVTDAVKRIWGKTVVGALAAYSIPLYLAPGAQGEEK